ncbi:MAG: WG repeat-containing protein [Pyrinomonadaceae bacterium]
MLALTWLAVTTVNAQAPDPPLFPIYDVRGMEGFIDIDGRVVIAPQFDKVTRFSEGRAAVRVGTKWGYIDRAGRIVIAPQFTEAAPFSEGLAAVTESSRRYLDNENESTVYRCGYIDREGRFVIPADWHGKCGNFSEGLAELGQDGSAPDVKSIDVIGYIDHQGKWMIQPQFNRTNPFREGFALVYHGLDRGLIDRTGRLAIFSKQFEVRDTFSEGLAPAVLGLHLGPDGRVASTGWGFLDKSGQEVFSLKATDLGGFSEGLAMVEFRGLNGHYALYGYVDRTGKMVIAPRFDSASSFVEGLAATSEGYIDHQGKVVLKTRGNSFSGGLAWVGIHNRTIGETPTFRNLSGYLNKTGKFVWVSPDTEKYMGTAWMRQNFTPPPSSPSPHR